MKQQHKCNSFTKKALSHCIPHHSLVPRPEDWEQGYPLSIQRLRSGYDNLCILQEHVALWSGKRLVVYAISQEKTMVRVAGKRSTPFLNEGVLKASLNKGLLCPSPFQVRLQLRPKLLSCMNSMCTLLKRTRFTSEHFR